MTYLRHMSEGNVEWAQGVAKISNKGWATPGRYLRNSTLRVLARKAFGEDLPEEMFEAFEGPMFSDDAGMSQDLEKKWREECETHNVTKLFLPPPRITAGRYCEDEGERDDVNESDKN